MPSPSRSSRRNRRDRLSISIFPDHSRDTEPQSPYLHWLFSESSQLDVSSRLVDDNLDSVDSGTCHRNTEATIMREVAAWLRSQEQDEFWVSKRHDTGNSLPTTSQLLARLKDTDAALRYTSNGTEGFDALVQAIALQLLASCYTYISTSSASHLPLFQQRTRRKSVSALRAHTLFRFSPAAGHHARANSETAEWPDFSPGPGPEEILAEWVSQKRRSAKRSNDYTPSFITSGWTDGGHDYHQREYPPFPATRNGIVHSSTCQPLTVREPHHRRSTWLTKVLCRKRKEVDVSPQRQLKARSILKVTTFTVHRFTSFRSTLCSRDSAIHTHRPSRPRFKLVHHPYSDPAKASTLPTPPKRPKLLHHTSLSDLARRAHSSPCTSDAGRDGRDRDRNKSRPPARQRPSYSPTALPSSRSARQWPLYSPIDRPALLATQPPTPFPLFGPLPYTPLKTPLSPATSQRMDDYFGIVTPAADPSAKAALAGREGQRASGSAASSSSESVKWDVRRMSVVKIEPGLLERGVLARLKAREGEKLEEDGEGKVKDKGIGS